mgnify:CR=1 FL=1
MTSAGAFRRDDLERVREATDIVELVGNYVALRKTGRHYKGLCPFHQEKTPSFIVFPETQTFHCFGCGVGGDAVSFLMRIEQLSFREALERLAERAGITLHRPSPQRAEQDAHLARLAELNRLAAGWFSHVLWNTTLGAAGRDLLVQRGIDRETAERFQLGFAPATRDALLQHLRKQGATRDELLEVGLIGQREDGTLYDRFRNRLIFPIRDREGKILGFGGRALGDVQPKYLNTPQTPLFDKSSVLYALDLAWESIRRTRQLIVVEGYIDAITAHQFGYTNVVASMGTALTERQVRLVHRAVDQIILALDADAAGQQATLRGLDVMREVLAEPDRPVPVTTSDADARVRYMIRFERTLRVDLRIARLIGGKDPDELIRNDRQAWDQAITHPVPLFDFYLDALLGTQPPTSPQAISALVQRIAPILREISDPIVQDHYVQQVARRLSIREELVRQAMRTSRGSPQRMRSPVPELAGPTRTPLTAEERCIALCLRYPQLAQALIAELDEYDVLDARNAAILEALRTADPSQLREDNNTWLPPEVQEYAEELRNRLPPMPETPASTTIETIRQAIHRLRRERHEAQVRLLHQEIREAEARGDREIVREHLQHLEQLRIRYPEFYPAPSPYFPDLRSEQARM